MIGGTGAVPSFLGVPLIRSRPLACRYPRGCTVYVARPARSILAISIVWTAEALNTAFEFLADAAFPEFHPLVRDAKDVAAGAVLITALAAAIIAAIVFWPYVARL